MPLVDAPPGIPQNVQAAPPVARTYGIYSTVPADAAADATTTTPGTAAFATAASTATTDHGHAEARGDYEECKSFIGWWYCYQCGQRFR